MGNDLKEWVNPLYLLPDNVKAIAKQLESEGHVQIADFFDSKKATTIHKEKVSWKKSYQPDLHKYRLGSVPKNSNGFFQSAAFRALLGTILGKNIKKLALEVLEFGKGDYTLLHDMEHDKEGIVVWFDFSKDWKEEFGGMTVVSEEGSDPLLFAPTYNALHIVSLEKNMGMFVKYVNSLAGKKKMLMIKGWV